MKHSNFKDFKKRIHIKNYELILLQQRILKILTTQFLESQQSLGIFLKNKNRCILTARAKGIHSDFKLSRIKVRELGLNGLINGLKKVSW